MAESLRVVYLVNPRTTLDVPELLVRFRCEKCALEGAQDVMLDAYDGPPVCQKHRVVLEGLSIMRTLEQKPDPTLDAGALESLQESSKDKGTLDRSATEELDARFGEVTPQ